MRIPRESFLDFYCLLGFSLDIMMSWCDEVEYGVSYAPRGTSLIFAGSSIKIRSVPCQLLSEKVTVFPKRCGGCFREGS